MERRDRLKKTQKRKNYSFAKGKRAKEEGKIWQIEKDKKRCERRKRSKRAEMV